MFDISSINSLGTRSSVRIIFMNMTKSSYTHKIIYFLHTFVNYMYLVFCFGLHRILCINLLNDLLNFTKVESEKKTGKMSSTSYESSYESYSYTNGVSKQIQLLRWKLSMASIDIPTAFNIIHRSYDSQRLLQEFQHYLTISNLIYYFNYHPPHQCKEAIILVHPTLNRIFIINFTAFGTSYTCDMDEQLWWNHNVSDNVIDYLQTNYRKLLALRRIRQYGLPYVKNWLEKPTTSDEKIGIWCRLSWKKLEALQSC